MRPATKIVENVASFQISQYVDLFNIAAAQCLDEGNSWNECVNSLSYNDFLADSEHSNLFCLELTFRELTVDFCLKSFSSMSAFPRNFSDGCGDQYNA